MTAKDPSTEERARRGKRLLLYGMFSLVIVTVVALFMTIWMLSFGQTGAAVRISLIVGSIAVVACVIVWFIYTRLILKE